MFKRKINACSGQKEDLVTFSDAIESRSKDSAIGTLVNDVMTQSLKTVEVNSEEKFHPEVCSNQQFP